MESNLFQEAADEILKELDDDYHFDSDVAHCEKANSNVNGVTPEPSGASGPVNETTRSYAEPVSVNGMMRNDADENSVNASMRINTQSCVDDDSLENINGKRLSGTELTRLFEFNKSFAHVLVGGKHKVASKVTCPQIGQDLCLESLGEFKNRFLTSEKIAGLNAGDAWLRWKGKIYNSDGLNYYPDPECCPGSVFNLYWGLSCAPYEGDVEPFLYHVREVICDGDSKAYNFLISWLAHMFQRPMEKPGVALVLKSVEGTGKGTFFEPLKRILGAHASQINGAYQLTGRFNAILANQQLLFADEVDLTDPKAADKLKGYITEPRVCLERKGNDAVQVANYSRFMFASNHDQVIRAGGRERRFLVLEPSSKHAQQHDYFSNLWEWIENEGPSHLLHYLLKYDISNFNPRKAPVTRALLDEKLHNLSPYQLFFMAELSKERPFDGAVRLATSDMVNKCRIWMEDNGFGVQLPRVRSALGKLIQRMGIDKQGKHGRNALYELPDRVEMQTCFARVLGQDREEIFD